MPQSVECLPGLTLIPMSEIGRCHTRGEYQECVTYMPLPSANKAVHCGFEAQRRHHQKSKTGASVVPQK